MADVDVAISSKSSRWLATGNTVVAGTLDAGATTVSTLSSGAATLSSTLDVAGDVDVSEIHGGLKFGGGGSDNTVEHAGCGGRRGRELWEIHGPQQVHGGWHTGNTVVAGTLDAGGTTLSTRWWLSSGASTLTLSSTLGVAGNVNVNSGKFTVASLTGDTAVAGATTLSSTLDVAGDVDVNSWNNSRWPQHGQHGGGGDAERRGDYGEHPELGGGDAVEHAGCGGRRGRELWEIHGGLTHGRHGGGGTLTTLSSTLDVAGDVDVNSGKFTVASTTGNTVVAGTLNAGATTVSTLSSGAATLSSTLGVAGNVNVNSGKFTVASLTGDTAVAGATTLSSTLDVAGDVDVNSGKFTVASTTGNTVVAGTLNAGATTVSTLTGR